MTNQYFQPDPIVLFKKSLHRFGADEIVANYTAHSSFDSGFDKEFARIYRDEMLRRMARQ